VRGVPQFRVTQPTERALAVVGAQYALAEHALMQALADHDFRVAASGGEVDRVRRGRPLLSQVLVHGGDELVPLGLLANEPHPRRDVAPRPDAVEVEEWQARPHRGRQSTVFGVFTVGPAPLVPEAAVIPDPVVARGLRGVGRAGGEDREGRIEPGRLADTPLLCDQRQPVSLERERFQVRALYDASPTTGDLVDVGEGRSTDGCVFACRWNRVHAASIRRRRGEIKPYTVAACPWC